MMGISQQFPPFLSQLKGLNMSLGEGFVCFHGLQSKQKVRSLLSGMSVGVCFLGVGVGFVGMLLAFVDGLFGFKFIIIINCLFFFLKYTVQFRSFLQEQLQ